MDDKAVRGIPWTVVTFGANKVITVLTTLALARLLVPADFGLFALATLGTGLLGIFSGVWLGAALILRPDMDERAQGTVLSLLLMSGATFAAVLLGLAPIAADFFGEPRLTGILALFAVILLISGGNWFYDTVLQRELEFRKRFISQAVRTVAFSSVALALAAAGVGVWSLVIAHLTGHVANGVTLFALAPYRVRPAFSRETARSVVTTSRGFLAQDLATYLQENADYIAIGRVLGSAQLGFYTLAYRQAELPHYAIADPVSRVTFPAFAQMRHRGEDIGPAYLTGLRLVALGSFPLGVILSAAAAPFVETLLGERWLPTIGPLAILGIWAMVRPIQATVGRLLNSIGHAAFFGRVAMVTLVPFAGATFIAAELAGITAVAWVLLAYITGLLVVLMFAVQRYAGVAMASQWRVLRPLAVASAMSWLVTRGVAEMTAGLPPALSLIASAGACFASYLVAVRTLDSTILPLAKLQLRRAAGKPPASAVAS
jgi:PST family polysaccharide transporter